LIDHNAGQYSVVSTPLRIVNRCCSVFPVSGGTYIHEGFIKKMTERINLTINDKV